MRLKLHRDSLAGALAKVGGVVERRQTLPILANLLVRAGEGRLELIGTDLEIEVRTTVEAAIEDSGDFTLPARKVIDICRALPEGSEVTVDLEGERAVLRAGRGRFTLSTLPARDYPVGEDRVADYQLSLKSRELRQLLEKSAFAMAQQDVRYYLNGLLLEVKKGELTAVATDGHRLAKATRRVDAESGWDAQVILPRKTVQELLRQLSDKDDLVRVELSGKFVRISFGTTVMTSKLIDARYPDYERVIPRGEGRLAVVDREGFRQALARTAILSNEKFKGILLDFEPGVMRLKAHNPEQEEAVEEQSIVYEGERMSVGFNVEYLMDVLGVVGSSELEMRILEENSSLRVIEAGDQTNTYVIMPMFL